MRHHSTFIIAVLSFLVAYQTGDVFGNPDQKANTSKMDFVLRNIIESTLLKISEAKQVCLTNLAGELQYNQSGELVFNVIIYTETPQNLRNNGIHLNSVFEHFSTARLTLHDIASISNLEDVKWIELGSPVYPTLDKSVPKTGASKLHAGQLNNSPYCGEGVIVGVYDTGIDWRHLDFRDDLDTTKSRILFLWDQTDSIGTRPTGYDYGGEYTNSQINSELKGNTVSLIRERDFNGHGTHVAGIAAGDGSSSTSGYIGMAPKADLIIVKGGEGSFSRARIIDGVNYIMNKAFSLGKPVVVNLSLGGQDGAHDGTESYEVAMNNLLNGPGRAIVVAAGNDGNTFIHAGGKALTGNTVSIKFTIPSYTPTAGTKNDYVYFDMWYKGSDWLTVAVTSPSGITRTAVSGSTNSGVPTSDGTIFIDNASKGTNSSNGDKECIIQIFDQMEFNPPAAGVWTISVTGATVPSTGDFDIWLYDKSSSLAQTKFSAGGDNSKTVSVPGTATRVITVGSWNTRGANAQGDTVLWRSITGRSYRFTSAVLDSISNFSSIGPTRDGRQKPEIAAPGSAIISARSSTLPFTSGAGQRITDSVFTVPDGKHFVLQGTSMAAPHVAGAAALLLQINPNLTSDQVKTLLTSTAQSDRYTGSLPDYVWGYGKMNAFTAAQRSGGQALVSFSYQLYQNYPNPFNSTTTITYGLGSTCHVSLKVYDVLGREVTTLFDGDRPTGIYTEVFDARQWNLASGVYFYRLFTSGGSGFAETKKMILIK